MTAIEIQQDAIYSEAYAAAEKAFNKKYNKLFELAKYQFTLNESTFGEPDENIADNKPYFALRKILLNN